MQAPAHATGAVYAFVLNADLGCVQEGTIILTHELHNFTMTEAIKFYPMLKTAFTHITPVGVTLNITSPYLEQEYALPSFAQCTPISFVPSLTY